MTINLTVKIQILAVMCVLITSVQPTTKSLQYTPRSFIQEIRQGRATNFDHELVNLTITYENTRISFKKDRFDEKKYN